ncbi:hypothetical protein BD626DRAFT_404597 [Schizophyllum amplum]|uniref:MYND-type domain-containing protein n=1 Tax=Schizophyllum amplum TaxID=97359 RepID=A0A550CB71_9AGAR|nr:hypothetical protein BD626DRAFT_404597 [Auriculariopsis ampla]
MGLRDQEEGLIMADIDHCVRSIWPTLVLWIDFLHPVHHVSTERMERVPLQVLCDILNELFRTDTHAFELCKETPRLYELLFLLWLRLDEYITPGTDVLHCLSSLSHTVNRSIYVVPKRSFMMEITNAQPYPDRVQAVADRYKDPHCIPAALMAVGHRPHKLYRKMLVQARLFVGVIPTLRSDEALEKISDSFVPISEFVTLQLVMHKYPKDIVCGFVDLIRHLHDISDGRGSGPARMMCSILSSIWATCDDGRSLAWSLRAGVLPVMIALNAEKSDDDLVSHALHMVTRKAYHVRVVREFLKGVEALSFIGAAFKGPNTLASYDSEIRRRVDMLQRWTWNQEKCLYAECHSIIDAVPVPVRRCPCFNAAYCSKACQRADWARHKPNCVNGVHGTRYMAIEIGDLSPEDAHFIAFYVRTWTHTHAQTLLQSVIRAQEITPSGSKPHTYHVQVNIGQLPVGYDFWVLEFPMNRQDVDSWLTFSATVTRPRGMALVQVMVLPLTALRARAGKSVAEGYPVEGYALEHEFHPKRATE